MSASVITGAAGGIGSAIATRLSSRGDALVLLDVAARHDELESLAVRIRESGGRALVRDADVRDQDALDAAFAAGADAFGGIRTVAANAGLWRPGAIDLLAEEDWQLQVDVNLTGAFRTIRAAVPYLRAAGSTGAVVITSSVAGLRGGGGGSGYVATKHGLGGLLIAAAHELGPWGVRVNSVNPTAVSTELIFGGGRRERLIAERGENGEDALWNEWAATRVLPVGWVEPEDVAAAVAFLTSDDARYITGVELPVDAGHAIRWGNAPTAALSPGAPRTPEPTPKKERNRS